MKVTCTMAKRRRVDVQPILQDSSAAKVDTRIIPSTEDADDDESEDGVMVHGTVTPHPFVSVKC